MNAKEFDPWRDLPPALGAPVGRGRIRVRDEDFVVTEELGFAPSGRGEHLFLRLRRSGCNTEWVAGQLARWGGRPRRDVGFAGLKDRHAVAEQWFSVHFPGGRHPSLADLSIAGVKLLECHAHDRKLRRGALRGNRFRLRVVELEAGPQALEARLQEISRRGVPNAFGPQRFGHAQGNLRLAADWFGGGRPPQRAARGFALSAARSLIFNAVLVDRISMGDWERALPGDPVGLDGRGSWFVAAADDPALAGRLEALEVHPTGPLWGRGEPPGEGPGRMLEKVVAERFQDLAAGLAAAGLRQERRALRLRVQDLDWSLEGDVLELSFRLTAGAYATAVLRELVVVD